jgi:hypothetical protein
MKAIPELKKYDWVRLSVRTMTGRWQTFRSAQYLGGWTFKVENRNGYNLWITAEGDVKCYTQLSHKLIYPRNENV